MNDLTLTNFVDDPYRIIANSALAETTKYKYTKALQHFLDDYGMDAWHDTYSLAEYAATSGISYSEKRFLKAAVGLVIDEVINRLNGMATPENENVISPAIRRLNAVKNAFKVESQDSKAQHVWLSVDETTALLNTCDLGDEIGVRDWLGLMLLVGAGLRREEAVNVTFSDVRLKPKNGEKWPVVRVVWGKEKKSRDVPIARKFYDIVQDWRKMTGSHGDDFILKSINQWGHFGDALGATGLFYIVRQHGALIGYPDLAPHDLRRTFAQNAYENGKSLREIQLLMGHASIATTGKYLRHDVDISSPVSDLFL
jgi:integrase